MAAIENYSSILLIALATILVVLVVVVAWVFLTLKKFQLRYANISAAVETGNLTEIITNQSDEIRKLQNGQAKIERDQNHLDQSLALAVQKIGLVRFDAFDDVGGKLSFSLALLDHKGDGILLSSINGRSENRVYAKPVKEGVSIYNLSIEEKEAIGQALR